jgi:histone H3
MKNFDSDNESEFASTITSEDFFPDIEKMTDKITKSQSQSQEEKNAQKEGGSSFDGEEEEILDDDSDLIDENDGASSSVDTPPQLQKMNEEEETVVIRIPVSLNNINEDPSSQKTTVNTTNETVSKPTQRSRKTLPQKRPVTTTTIIKGVRRPHRFRSGTVALREIRKYQKSTEALLPKRPFQRLVREIAESIPRSMTNEPMRFTRQSLDALQEAAESYMVNFFEDAYFHTVTNKRIELGPKDIHFVKKLRGKDSNI